MSKYAVYSGSKFPVPPKEWSREVYPHAMVVDTTGGGKFVYSKSPFIFTELNSTYNEIKSSEGAVVFYHEYDGQNPKWGEQTVCTDSGGYSVWAYTSSSGTYPVLWHTGLYSESGSVVVTASPAIKVLPVVLKDFVFGHAIGLAGEVFPFSKKHPVYDNEWPIGWSYPATLANHMVALPESYHIKVSDLIPDQSEWEKLALEITKDGTTSVYRYTYSLPFSDLSYVSLQNDAEETILLSFVHKPTTFLNSTYTKTGIYYNQEFADTAKKEYNLYISDGAEPIAYSYNGVILPALPEWDREAYITEHKIFSKTIYRVHLTSDPYYAIASDGEYAIGYRKGDMRYTAEESTWTYEKTYDQDGVWASLTSVIWANFDVKDESGAVVLDKSNPIPVYE